MYLKSFIFFLCAYSLVLAKPASVNLSSGDTAERQTSITGLSGDQPKPTHTTHKRQAGDSSALFNAVQLNPLYALSEMAELKHADAISRRKRQQTGSNANVIIPSQICTSVLSTLNDDSIHVACPSSGHNNVWYQCEYQENRNPRYLIQATSCQTDRSCGSQCPTNGQCRDHNATVTIAEHTGDFTWRRVSTQIRLGCQCQLQ